MESTFGSLKYQSHFFESFLGGRYKEELEQRERDLVRYLNKPSTLSDSSYSEHPRPSLNLSLEDITIDDIKNILRLPSPMAGSSLSMRDN